MQITATEIEIPTGGKNYAVQWQRNAYEYGTLYIVDTGGPYEVQRSISGFPDTPPLAVAETAKEAIEWIRKNAN